MFSIFRTVILVIILGVLGYVFESSYIYDEGELILVVTMAMLAISLYFTDNSKGSVCYHKLLRPSFLLLLGMTIIALQNSVDLLLGNYDVSYQVFYHPNIIVKGVAYASMAIVAFIIGYTNTKHPLSHRVAHSQTTPLTILITLSTIFFFLFLTTVDSNFLSGKTYVESGSIDSSHTNNSEFFLGICYAGVLIQYAINNAGRGLNFRKFISGIPKIFLIIFISYLILRLISGAREPVIRNILIFVFSYIYTSRKQPIKNYVLFIFLFLASFFLSIISIGRGVISEDLSEKYKVGTSIYETRNSFSPSTTELAGSQFCDMAAINEFERHNNEFLKGSIQGRYVLVLFIPNRLLQHIWPIDTSMQGSAYYLTVKEKGYKSNIGLGTTLQTDFYVDFGIVGMLICLFLIGVLFKRLDLALYTPPQYAYSLLTTVFLIYISACSFYLSRSAFIPMLRIPLYIFILLYINRKVYTNK